MKEKFQQSAAYDFTLANSNSWVRLRTDGNKTTLTVKEIHNDDGVDGTKELEVSVDNGGNACLTTKLGTKHKVPRK